MTAIITLTTDFGTVDGYVGAMKGRILSMNPEVTIVDLTHEIESQALMQAAWSLKRSTATFPSETVHVAVIDPGVGSNRDALLIRSGNRWFVGPDNGVFSEIIRSGGIQQGVRLYSETAWWKKHSSFDGLSLFAPAAACLTNGIDPLSIGEPIQECLMLDSPQPVVENGAVVGDIILFDRFGNAMTNIHKSLLKQLGTNPDSAEVAGRCFPVVDHYEQGAASEGVSIINSDGYLELAVFASSARERFGLAIGDRVLLK